MANRIDIDIKDSISILFFCIGLPIALFAKYSYGSTSSNNEYVKKNVSDEYLLEMMDAIDTDILLMGTRIFHFTVPYFVKRKTGKSINLPLTWFLWANPNMAMIKAVMLLSLSIMKPI